MLFKTATSRNIFSIVAVGVVTTVAAASTLFTLSYGHTKATSLSEMNSAARISAAGIEERIANGMQLVRTLAHTMQAKVAAGAADRTVANGILAEIQRNTPDILGVWTGWEANAFDGRDAEHAGTTGHDATGRYIPYATGQGDSINFDPLLDYAEPGAGDYYQLALRSEKPVILEPFAYEVNGEDTLMTSLTMPITVGGRTVGVAGVDLGLSDMAAMLGKTRPLGDGFVALLSRDGSFVGHPDASFLGRPLEETVSDPAAWRQMIANPGEAVETAGAGGVSHLSVAIPVQLLDDTSWFTVVSVPQATVYAYLTQMAYTSLAIIAGAVLLLVVLGVLISGRFRRRLEGIIAATGQIAGGRMDIELEEAQATDEIGEMARSLVVLRDAAIAKEKLEQEADLNRNLTEAERAEREQLKAKEAADIQFAVDSLAAGLGRLAEGDVAYRIETPFADSLDSLRANFNGSVEKLQHALRAVGENARAIDSGAGEIRSASDDLAQRTSQQAASVEETAAAIEEVTTTVRNSSQRAEQAGEIVEKTRVGAEKSSDIVRGAVAAMQEIAQSSDGISNIIGVIDDIAFQTNLLALNAGVEAARAGEAGRGFAVVAHEVRELAQRSATAAKEIKQLITTSGSQVRSGVDLVEQTGAALNAIVADIGEISHHVSAIVTAAREQARGIEEINVAVGAIDRGTQQNAAMVEQSTAACHGLANEAEALNRLIAQFNLGDDAAARRAAPVAASASSAAVPSPARGIRQKLARAFGAGGPAAAGAEKEWEEF